MTSTTLTPYPLLPLGNESLVIGQTQPPDDIDKVTTREETTASLDDMVKIGNGTSVLEVVTTTPTPPFTLPSVTEGVVIKSVDAKENDTVLIAESHKRNVTNDTDTTATDSPVNVTDAYDLINVTETQPSVNVTDTQPSVDVTVPQALVNVTEPPLSMNVTETQPSVNVTDTQTPMNVTETLPSMNVTDTQPSANVTETQPSANVSDIQPSVNVTETSPSVNVTGISPSMNVTDIPPTMNVTDIQPSVNVTDIQPSVNVTDTSLSVNVTETPLSMNVTETQPTVNVTEIQPSANFTDRGESSTNASATEPATEPTESLNKTSSEFPAEKHSSPTIPYYARTKEWERIDGEKKQSTTDEAELELTTAEFNHSDALMPNMTTGPVLQVTEISDNITTAMDTTTKEISSTDSPSSVAEFPSNATDFPMNITDFPSNATDFPINITDFPVNITEFPSNVTDVPSKTALTTPATAPPTTTALTTVRTTKKKGMEVEVIYPPGPRPDMSTARPESVTLTVYRAVKNVYNVSKETMMETLQQGREVLRQSLKKLANLWHQCVKGVVNVVYVPAKKGVEKIQSKLTIAYSNIRKAYDYGKRVLRRTYNSARANLNNFYNYLSGYYNQYYNKYYNYFRRLFTTAGSPAPRLTNGYNNRNNNNGRTIINGNAGTEVGRRVINRNRNGHGTKIPARPPGSKIPPRRPTAGGRGMIMVPVQSGRGRPVREEEEATTSAKKAEKRELKIHRKASTTIRRPRLVSVVQFCDAVGE
nr:hypothetical protein BaRGS_022066 [Batillaria attramentaria]